MRYSNNKYNARKAYCQKGHLHDSIAEAGRCDELNLLCKCGEITGLEIQKKYLLIPAFYRTEVQKDCYKTGKLKGQHKVKCVCEERSVVYRADFVYFDKKLGKTVIEDCKGIRTKEYIIKRKLMKMLYCKDGNNTVFIET